MDKEFYSHRYTVCGEYGQGEYNLDHLFQIRAVKKWLAETPSLSLLDVGCGAGVFCRQVFDRLGGETRVKEVAGVDLVDSVEEKPTSEFRFATCDLNEEELPFETASFNLVFSNHVVEHLFNTEHFFSELGRVVRLGGLAVVSTPNLAWWVNRLLLVLGIQPVGTETGTQSVAYGMGLLRRRFQSFHPAGHIRPFTPGALSDMGHAAGLKTIGWWGQNSSPVSRWAPRLSRSIGVVLQKQ